MEFTGRIPPKQRIETEHSVPGKSSPRPFLKLGNTSTVQNKVLARFLAPFLRAEPVAFRDCRKERLRVVFGKGLLVLRSPI